jgi:hypothetical protein
MNRVVGKETRLPPPALSGSGYTGSKRQFTLSQSDNIRHPGNYLFYVNHYMVKCSLFQLYALPHQKSNPKETLPHFEKVTQIKADYPELSSPGGQNGVNHETEISSNQAGPFPLPTSRTERKVGHSGRIHQDPRLQKPEVRPTYPQ